MGLVLFARSTGAGIVNRQVLVTGANGFVGRQLCLSLEAANFEVRASSLRLGQDERQWLSQLGGVSSVVHLAACVHRMRQAVSDEQDFQRDNVDGTRFVAELAARSGIRRFVFLSSIKVNGEGACEQAYQATDVPNPQDAYGRSKWHAEQALQEVCASSSMEWVVVRSPLVFGPGVRANFRRLMSLAQWPVPLPFASLRNRRSMIGISNLVDFLRTCLEHPGAGRRVWLIAEDEALSTHELLSRMAALMGRRIWLFPMPRILLECMATPIGMRNEISRLSTSLLVDARPARDELNWRSVKSIDEELGSTVRRFLVERRS